MQGGMLRCGKIKKKRASPVRRKPYPVKTRFLCVDGITKHKGCQFEYSKRGMTIDRYVTIIKNRKKKERNKGMKVITFHNPDEENGYLSNWYLSDFTVGDVKYTSMEQYMMHQKAVVFGDNEIAKQILATDDVADIKQLGRKVSGYIDNVWNGVRQIIIFEGLMAKYSQNPELGEKLKATGNAILAEAAVNDRIWGIGLSMKDPKRLEPKQWNGQNLMGYATMLVRERI